MANFNSVGPQDFELTLTVPGVYGYRCTPHFGLGMVGLIVVTGEAKTGDWKVNLEAAKSIGHPGKAKKTFELLWPELENLMRQ